MRNIHLLPDGGNQFFQNEKTYFVCLPPILATKNIALTVSFVDSESISLVKRISNVSLDRHQIQETKPLKLTGNDYHLTISNADDFEEWYNKGLEAYPEVTIKGSIDMTGRTLEAKNFSGIISGNNCEIKNLTMSKSTTGYNGFFASLNGADVSNITLTNLTIIGNGRFVGAICGVASDSRIIGCKVNNANVAGQNVGGLVGDMRNTFVDGCELTDIVLSPTSSCGGLVADFSETSNICASYITGKINDVDGEVGGIIYGWNDYYAKIISCYSFMELPSNARYVYRYPYPNAAGAIEMNSSWYVNNSVKDDDVKTVEGLQNNEITTMNSYLESNSSEYRYVVNPAAIKDFSTPPLILQKAQ